MLLEFAIALIIGILAGTLSGLTPGIHINLISLLLLSLSTSFLTITTPIILVIFIVSMTITHTFIDFIPSVFLGAPDEDSFLSILPGHRLLLEGYGYVAVILTLYGGITALLIILFFTPLFIIFLPIIYSHMQKIMFFILLTISIFLILEEKENKLLALLIFLLSGILGVYSLNLNINQPIFPLLTGLFGVSGLIISINQKTKIPIQKILPLNQIKISKSSFLKSISASILASPLTAFLPGLGSSQSALIGKQIVSLNEREFLFLVGAINTIVAGLSIVTYYSISKTRTGTAVAISQLIPSLTFNDLLLIITAIIFSGFLSFFIGIYISKFAARNITKINYSKISFLIVLFLIALTFLFTGFLGIIVLATSTFLGISAILFKVKRIHLMGCLLVPTILYYAI